MAEPFFRTERLTVGYNGVPLIRDIEIRLDRGRILTLIGPNGSGKSTVLKSITNYLKPLCGAVYLESRAVGGMTGGDRTVRLSKDAEAQGASGVVVNAPMTNDVIEKMAKVIDIPIIATVLSEKADIQARLDAGVSILNVSAAARTPEVVSAIREKFPKVPIIATGGPTGESIARTIGAGANSISYTPPSTKELFSRTMEDYRSREL